MLRLFGRLTFINWICLGAVTLVFSLILVYGLVAHWQENGVPEFMRNYGAWEREHTPRWFVHLFDFLF